MTKAMTKTQLVAEVAAEMGADRKTAAAAIEALAAVVARTVTAGGTVTLPGLDRMTCRERPERQVRNPQTGETLMKPADRQVKFAIARALKDGINA